MALPTEPEILASVPHRPPILRIHRVVAADDASARTVGAEPTGPGALAWELGAIEGLAQSAAVLLGRGAPPPATADAAPRGMLVAVKRFAVRAHPPAGAEITYRVRLVRRLGTTAMVAGTAELADGTPLAGGELTLWTAPTTTGA